MPFEHLVLQRGEQGAGHASQPEVTVVRDVADDVPRLVDVAAGEAPRASPTQRDDHVAEAIARAAGQERDERIGHGALEAGDGGPGREARSEEHTSELQSQSNLVCRLLLEKKKKQNN